MERFCQFIEQHPWIGVAIFMAAYLVVGSIEGPSHG